MPLIRRLREEDLCSNLCWLLVCSRTNLPLPVTRTRFAVPLWVFCFGMSLVLFVSVGARQAAQSCRTAPAVSVVRCAAGQALGACSSAADAPEAVAFSAFAERRAASVAAWFRCGAITMTML